MITLVRNGTYELVETKNRVKIMHLGDDAFVWVEPKKIGGLLTTTSRTPRATDYTLGMGRYNLYDVEDEPHLTDLQHLELEVGKGIWQGYLLLTGLPSSQKKRSRIIPTTQIITDNPRYFSVISKTRALASMRGGDA